MRWSNWARFVFSDEEWLDERGFDDGPAAYELAIGGPKRGIQQVVYIGETDNEYRRMYVYGSGRSHIEDFIQPVLSGGLQIYHRSIRLATKKEALAMQDKLLERNPPPSYPWNKQRHRR